MVEVVYRKKRKIIATPEPEITPTQAETIQVIQDIPNVSEAKNIEIEHSVPPKQIHNTPEEAQQIKDNKFKLAKAWLRETWPDLFAKENKPNPRLLKVGIRNDIYAHYKACGGYKSLHFNFYILQIYIKSWVNQDAYLNKCVLGEPRYDLNGNIVTSVDERQVEFATQVLANKRAKRQRQGKTQNHSN